jgi:hypothetical protein
MMYVLDLLCREAITKTPGLAAWLSSPSFDLLLCFILTSPYLLPLHIFRGQQGRHPSQASFQQLESWAQSLGCPDGFAGNWYT